MSQQEDVGNGGEHGSGERRSFVGISRGEPGADATLEAALQDAAEHTVRNEAVMAGKPVWYDLALQVEIGNQHIKTFRATLTPRE